MAKLAGLPSQSVHSQYVTYRSYPEEWRFRKDVGFNLMGCAPDVLLVLSIFGESEYQNSAGKTWSKDQGRSQRSENTGSEVRDVGMLENDLDKRRTRVSSLH
jgi:hypothetical protein